MHSIKKIVISFSFVVQGLISGAQICPSIPKEITLVCDNEEKIERVPVALLMNNFGFFTSYFERWDRFSDTINQGELRIHASADAMGHLLVSVRNYSEGVGAFPEDEPTSAISLLILADRFLLKKEAMDCLKEQYGDAVNKELYSHSSYEKFLRGDREAILAAWAVDKKFTPAPIFEPELKHSTAGYEEDQRDLRRQREQQEAAERQVREEEYRIKTREREEDHRRRTHEIEEEYRRRRHQGEEESRRTLNTILSLPYYPAPYYPEPYVSSYYSQPSHNQSLQAPKSSSLLPPRPRPQPLLPPSRPQLSFFAEQERKEKQRRKEALLFWGNGSSVKKHSVQQEEIAEKTFSQERVKPTVFSKDGMKGVGFSATNIYVYDDAEHLLLEHSFYLGKCLQGYAIGGVAFVDPYKLQVTFKKKDPKRENSHYIHQEIIYLPSYESTKAFVACTNEERYLYHALRSSVKDAAGNKFDRLSLPSLEHEKMFDRLPKKNRSEILSSKGLVERVLAKRVETIYRNMKQSSENKCRELQVYKPV